ncbi:prospero homeobox 3 isoform X2 [Takifugu rubripes]|nr:prospero homeobox protein 1-like isoform X2 [Takifugu rubripes]
MCADWRGVMPTWEGPDRQVASSPALPPTAPLHTAPEDDASRRWMNWRVMDSPSDLFEDSGRQIHTFASTLSSSDLTGVQLQPSTRHPPPAFRPLGFPLIHNLLHPGGATRRVGGQLNPNLRSHRHLEEVNLEENMQERDGRVDHEMDGLIEGEDSLLVVKKRHSDTVLLGEWSQDVLKVKRVRNGEPEEGGKKNQAGRKQKRREREELKEQLEEARERLQALQEKVWKVFGEKHRVEEERSQRGNRDAGDEGMVEEEDMFEEDDGGDLEKENFSLLSGSPFENFHKHREEKQKDTGGRTEREREGQLHLEGATDGADLTMEAEDWNGMEDEGEEGGQKFAQALKSELGSAVARVIDRVLRLYTEMTDVAESSPPSAISFLPTEAGNNDGRESGVWMGLLMGGRGEDKTRGKGEKTAARDDEGEKQLQKLVNHIQPHRAEALDLAIPLAVQKSPDMSKAHPLLGPPFPTHPSLALHHPSLPRPPPLSHPSLLPPTSQSKDVPSSFHQSSSSSSSSSSYPVPPQPPHPLPLPLLHYSMQQLFSRSLHHPQLPHLTPSRKDYLSAEPFFDFSSHPSTHPTFPPLPLLGPLDPSLVRHSGKERERGMRGDGGMRGGLDGGELYLTAGGTQEGLSPCHLKKAKLMFFYARYPSSNTLKTYFPDVKFNRCVTSQMIKWFSNFREFFYIQMERFARQAVREALTREGAPCLGRDSQLRVGRDTELYRILNMHYNKSNVYQVPERFIEVSEVALREFYSAIWTGRDSDPCWKKGIYKIICKLDSPVPDTFRLPGCPMG